MFLPPPLKSSAAIRAASTEPMPLVSWKMPEISLSTPTRTTSPEISARAASNATHDKASARQTLRLFIVSSPIMSRLRGDVLSLNLSPRQSQDQAVELSCKVELAGQ